MKKNNSELKMAKSAFGGDTMRKMAVFTFTMVLVLAFAQNGFSWTTVSLSANPFVDPSYDFYTSTSGYVDYHAVVTYADPGGDLFTKLNLYFGGPTFAGSTFSPIFDNSLVEFAGVISAPSGASWTSTSFAGGKMTLSGTGLSVGQSIVFRVNYALFNPAGAGALGFSSHSAWSQNYSAYSPADTDGMPGSASLAPEPGTILLLGSGLLSLGLVKRFRERRRMSS